MARIVIDAHAIGSRLTGNETYISNLIDGLIGLDAGHDFVLLFTDPATAGEWQAKYHSVTTRIVSSNPLIRIPLAMPWLTNKMSAQLLHVQYVGPPVSLTPLVATIHDISYESHPACFTQKEIAQFKATIPFTAKLARKIITISESSKQDLMDIYHVPEERVVVTYLGANDRFVPPASMEECMKLAGSYGIDGPYFLAVGNLQPRKNLVRLVEAYERLRQHRQDIAQKLVIVGKKAWKYDPILSFVNRSRWVNDIILTDYVADEDLPALYGAADVFVYPSIYEGFGLPPLEAMACGTPVVFSDRGSLPEVVGNAGIPVDPYDVDDIAAAMAVMVLDKNIAGRFREAGLQRSRRFSWKRCAEQTMQVYEDVIQEARAG